MYRWEPSSETSSWLSPCRLSASEVGAQYDFSNIQENIRRGGSTRSLQLDYRKFGYSGDRCQEDGQEAEKRTFQWERNQSGKWERMCVLDWEQKRRHGGEGKSTCGRSRDVGLCQDLRECQRLRDHDSCEDMSSPIYEEYQESDNNPGQVQEPECLYDTLPPTRAAYEGYPSGPPGINLHPAQLQPPLRAWELHTGEWGGSLENRGLGSSNATGSGDELERLLNLVSLRARRATRVDRASTRSEPPTDWDSFKWAHDCLHTEYSFMERRIYDAAWLTS